MKCTFLSIWLFMLLMLTSCEKLFIEEEISNNQVNNFEILWNDFNNYYPFFQIKQINWDSIYDYYRPQVNKSITDKVLLDIFTSMIIPLNDGHVNLYTRYGTVNSYPLQNLTKDYSTSRLFPQNYLSGFNVNNSNINSWDVRSHNIGYISINSFDGKDGTFTFSSKSFTVIDDIINKFKDKDGIIIDIRWNTGGNPPNAVIIADRFADKKRLFARVSSKNGPGKYDFSDWMNWYIEPAGKMQYSKPVAILTSRKTGSTSEWFILAMKTLPQVTTVGDTTNGSFSEPLSRELPNGWSFRLSTKIVAAADLKVYEGTGIPPDITVRNTTSDFDKQTDAMLEKAIEMIESKNGNN